MTRGTLHRAGRARRRWLTTVAAAPLALGQPAPAGQSGRPFTLAFGSCAHQEKAQPIWSTIAAARPDLFLFLGDNLYADTRDAATLRERYAQFGRLSAVQAFRRGTPHLATWDDHDFGDDDAGGDYPLKALSQQLFCDAWNEPPDSPRRRRDGIYTDHRVQVGPLSVQVLMLDLRFNRTPLSVDPALKQSYAAMVLKARLSGAPMAGWYRPNPDPSATLLGARQWAWLEQRLAEPADVRVLASSVQFAAEGTGWEGWANFPRERQRLIDLLRRHRADGAVFVSGDMHYGEISRLPARDGPDLWDVTSSGLTEVWDVPTPNDRRTAGVLAEVNFGLLEIDPVARRLTMSVCDQSGRRRLSQAVDLSALRW